MTLAFILHDDKNELRRASLSARDHSTGDLAICQIHFEFLRRRRFTGGTRIVVSHETVRRWVNHFGLKIAADLRNRKPRAYTVWHLDEVYRKIDGHLVYLWKGSGRLVQAKQNEAAALWFVLNATRQIVTTLCITAQYSRGILK
jgi:hypothetical protein